MEPPHLPRAELIRAGERLRCLIGPAAYRALLAELGLAVVTRQMTVDEMTARIRAELAAGEEKMRRALEEVRRMGEE